MSAQRSIEAGARLNPLYGASSIDGLPRAGRHRGSRHDVFEHGKAVRRFRHDREMKPALRTGLREPRLLLMQIVRLVFGMSATRADSNKARALQFKIHDYVFHDRAGTNGPLFGMFVVGVHV